MQKYMAALTLFFFLSITAVVWAEIDSGQTQKTESLFIAGDDDFAPYSFDEGGQAQGIDCEIVRAAAKKAGLKVKIKLFPWPRLLAMLKKGGCDGAFSLFLTDERQKYADFILSRPVHTSSFKFYVKKGREFVFSSVEDLAGKRIGINRGFALTPDFVDARKRGLFAVEEVEGIEQNLRKLLKYRVDVVLENHYVTSFAAKRAGVSNEIVALATPFFNERGAYLALSKQAQISYRQEILIKLGSALRDIHQDGTVDTIISHYLPK